MRRRCRRISRSNPLPPLRPVFTRQNAFQQSKPPLFMTCLVLCYWQPTEAQQLAGVAQLRRAGSAGLVLGGVAFGGPMGR
jgi:hypothetical protein